MFADLKCNVVHTPIVKKPLLSMLFYIHDLLNLCYVFTENLHHLLAQVLISIIDRRILI